MNRAVIGGVRAWYTTVSLSRFPSNTCKQLYASISSSARHSANNIYNYLRWEKLITQIRKDNLLGFLTFTDKHDEYDCEINVEKIITVKYTTHAVAKRKLRFIHVNLSFHLPPSWVWYEPI